MAQLWNARILFLDQKGASARHIASFVKANCWNCRKIPIIRLSLGTRHDAKQNTKPCYRRAKKRWQKAKESDDLTRTAADMQRFCLWRSNVESGESVISEAVDYTLRKYAPP